MSHAASPLEALIDSARAGDSEAEVALVERLYPRVQSLVHRALETDFRRHNDWILPLFSTGDVVHDLLSQAVRTIEGFTGSDEAALSAYLARAVRNQLVDAVRFHRADRRDSKKSEPIPAGDELAHEAQHGPGTLAGYREHVAVFHAALARMGERDRKLISARLVDCQPFDSIARELGYASADSARKMYHRTHAKLLLALEAAGVRAPGRDEP